MPNVCCARERGRRPRTPPSSASLVEFIVHGSDITRSIGGTDEIDEQLAAVAWAAMAPLAEVTAVLGVFGPGPSGELDDDATAADRLLDVTGRRR